jgi:diaminohydroxyphosphoribosylaminopyrimidine deaminase/5-amino-6-(5-phosphoribosylamino)uracil reductase
MFFKIHMTDFNTNFMLRALQLGKQAQNKTGDNPWVGCVIVNEGQVLGEGYTHAVGGPHAEVDAIQHAEAQGHSLAGSTLYCTVEPCSFIGRTPSCAKTIVEKQISHVVLAIRDPHTQVNGEGIRILKAGGIRVTEGIEELAVRRSLETWLKVYE